MRVRKRAVSSSSGTEVRTSLVPTDRSVPGDLRSEIRSAKVLPEPNASENYLYVEQQVTRVEDLLLQGVRTPNEIIGLLRLHPSDRPKVLKWMRMARARWEVTAGEVDMRGSRAEALRKMSNVEQELWILQGQTKDTREKIVILGQIRETVKQIAEFNGLNKDTIPALMSEEQVPASVRRSMDKQKDVLEGLRILAQAMREVKAAKNPDIIDADTGGLIYTEQEGDGEDTEDSEDSDMDEEDE